MHDFVSLTVARVDRETPDAIAVHLAVPPGLSEVFAWRPGQHLAFRFLLAGEEVRRTYSICSGPGDPNLRIAIKRVAGGRVSNMLNETLKPGMSLEAMPPAGRFVLPPAGDRPRHVVGFAAGVGITPIIAMVKHALALEPKSRVTLVYGNRSVEHIMFRAELDDLKDRHLERFTLLHILSRNDEGASPFLVGRIGAGTVRRLAGWEIRPNEVTEAFVCGPDTMIRTVRDELFAIGLPRERVHHEFFAPARGRAPPLPLSPSAPTRASIVGSAMVEVVAIVDGMRHVFPVPQGQRIVDAALAAGVRVPYSCKGGMCSTCRARVIEGEVEMAVNYSLEPWETEKGFVLTCQSLPRSERVVLDYDQM